jgi:hypothetical protein
LKSLPKALDETYERILVHIDELYKEDLQKVLWWLYFCERPVTLEEMVDVLAVTLDDDPRFESDQRYPEPRDILTRCSSLDAMGQAWNWTRTGSLLCQGISHIGTHSKWTCLAIWCYGKFWACIHSANMSGLSLAVQLSLGMAVEHKFSTCSLRSEILDRACSFSRRCRIEQPTFNDREAVSTLQRPLS